MSRKTISEEEKIRAAVNAPAKVFELGGKTFEIKDLKYDDYLEFVGYVSPLIDLLINRVKVQGLNIPGVQLDSSQFDTLSILKFCGDKLPAMARLVCRNTDPDITEEQIKSLCTRPLQLANVVLMQMDQNGIIKDFTDFFGQMVKTLAASRLKA